MIDDKTCEIFDASGDIFIANPEDVFKFDHHSKLFITLMKHAKYRECHEIKTALKTKKLSFADYNMEFNLFDFDLQEPEFKELLLRFYKSKNVRWTERCDENVFKGLEVSNSQEEVESEDSAYYKLFDTPVQGTKNLSMHKLYTTVCKYGGMDNVINLQIWKKLFFGYMPKTNASFTMKSFYKKYLYEFELARHPDDEACYKFKIDDHLTFIADNRKFYCGNVRAMRNRGINVYYLQFLNCKNDTNEWFAEDILRLCDGICNFHDLSKISSKTNNFVDDPITREKHSHGHKRMRKMFKKTKKRVTSVDIKKADIRNNEYPANLNKSEEIITVESSSFHLNNSVLNDYETEDTHLLEVLADVSSKFKTKLKKDLVGASEHTFKSLHWKGKKK